MENATSRREEIPSTRGHGTALGDLTGEQDKSAAKGMATVLSAESQKENGPFDSRNRRGLVFSMGAGNESHGAALASNIYDYAAIATATTVSMRLGLTYL